MHDVGADVRTEVHVDRAVHVFPAAAELQDVVHAAFFQRCASSRGERRAAQLHARAHVDSVRRSVNSRLRPSMTA